ncbi:anti-sigma factor family protein [Chitinophagaceae bacterium MMS25-I14]
MSDLRDIWQQGDELPQDKLMAYLEGRLSPEERHEVEAWLAGEGMESDAVEGLQELTAAETKDAVSRINHQLRKELTGRRPRRKRDVNNTWSWVAILIILLLAILAFIVIKMSVSR